MKRFLKYDTEIAKKENSPVDKNGLIKEDIGGGGGVQPDWNQLEESEPDFIKNKPFGKVKGKHIIDETYLSLTFSDNVATATLNTNFSQVTMPDLVIVKIQTLSSSDIFVYDDVPCVNEGYNPGLAEHMYKIGGDGYPFTITNTQLTLDTTVFTNLNSVIYKLEVLDMTGTEIAKIDGSYMPIDYIANNLSSTYAKLKSSPVNSNNGDMLVYDYGSNSFLCRSYLMIKSSSGKKFKLVVNDLGELSTEEINS